jgi:hypothetical protein
MKPKRRFAPEPRDIANIATDMIRSAPGDNEASVNYLRTHLQSRLESEYARLAVEDKLDRLRLRSPERRDVWDIEAILQGLDKLYSKKELQVGVTTNQELNRCACVAFKQHGTIRRSIRVEPS